MQSHKPTVFEYDGLGTHWWVEAELPASVVVKIEKRIYDFERDYSRFLPGSYIGRLNDKKNVLNPPKELLDMLAYQRAMFEVTDGVFNVTVGSVLEKNGYGLAGTSGKLQQVITNAITITENTIVLQEDTRLDLGGFGKGWLIDQIAVLLRSEGITSYVINGGGDILVGDQSKDLFIEHPLDASMHVGGVSVQNGALASSSRLKRQWEVKDKHYTHIVDTASVNREQSLLSVHVRTETALLADTLATVFLIVSHEKRIELAKLFNVAFLELRTDTTLWATADFGYLEPKVL